MFIFYKLLNCLHKLLNCLTDFPGSVQCPSHPASFTKVVPRTFRCSSVNYLGARVMGRVNVDVNVNVDTTDQSGVNTQRYNVTRGGRTASLNMIILSDSTFCLLRQKLFT